MTLFYDVIVQINSRDFSVHKITEMSMIQCTILAIYGTTVRKNCYFAIN